MLELGQIKIRVQDAPEDEKAYLREYAAEKLGVPSEGMRKFEVYKRSLDARNKPEIFYIYSVRFLADDEESILKKNHKNKNLRMVKKQVMYESRLTQLRQFADAGIVVVGSGPAGLFAAYALALRGLRPIVIERGAPMEERVGEVERFWRDGVLNEECNVCFGEGGAGTFSDGKLNSGVKDRDGSKRFILETFVRFGANREVLYDAKPHIGTDVLRTVIVNMRKAMEKQGCVFLFHTKFMGVEKRGDRVSGVWVKQGELRDTIPCEFLVLAIGHSARDTFKKLHEQRIEMCAKPFAVGVRVQHRQSDIDRAQYGAQEDDKTWDAGASEDAQAMGQSLPAATYKLTGKTSDDRGVYSFCMCPGGYVVNASTEPGGLLVNGMSNVGRDSGSSNAAIVVTVDPAGAMDGEDIFVGVNYQRELEHAMYHVAAGKIPVQRYGEFKQETDRLISTDVTEEGSGVSNGGAPEGNVHIPGLSSNQPAVMGQWTYADVASALPEDIATAVREAIDQFGKKIQGFDADDTLILGVESRTSSPVRIVRDDESLESISLPGLYPCGEGAGYAGGILSAAMDGLRVAERIGERLMQ
ncbi:MAG: FAD-binding protein [Eubacterium sp.]|nr:FAD-binding protein [Eubacterium sp.]